MLRLLLLAVLGTFLLCESARLSSPHFDEFMQKHGKAYSTEVEHNLRYWIFYKNMAKWELMNKMERGTATYGMNEFADLTEEEFTAKYLARPLSQNEREAFKAIPEAAKMNLTDVPRELDWREMNAVTPIKNQGECGSCWAFSTTGNIEGRWAIKTGNLFPLSEQQLVDCDHVDHGCYGGLPWDAVDEVQRMGGLVKEEDYPYLETQVRCRLDSMTDSIVATVTGKERVDMDEDEIKAYIAANGPVSAGINAAAMLFYEGGISHPWFFQCTPLGLNHAVLITGYGEEDGEPYWNIKNTWGTGWGERGYYRIHRGSGSCGINLMVTSAIV